MKTRQQTEDALALLIQAHHRQALVNEEGIDISHIAQYVHEREQVLTNLAQDLVHAIQKASETREFYKNEPAMIQFVRAVRAATSRAQNE
jgi:type IV secretory pathway component VirB8